MFFILGAYVSNYASFIVQCDVDPETESPVILWSDKLLT